MSEVILVLSLTGLRVYSSVFEDKSNRLSKVTSSIFLCSSLAVGARNFRAVCNIPVVVFLDDSSKLIQHLRSPQSAFNRTPYEKSPQVTLATLNDSSTNHNPWYFCSTSEVTSM